MLDLNTIIPISYCQFLAFSSPKWTFSFANREALLIFSFIFKYKQLFKDVWRWSDYKTKIIVCVCPNSNEPQRIIRLTRTQISQFDSHNFLSDVKRLEMLLRVIEENPLWIHPSGILFFALLAKKINIL